ncbi:aspartyl-phosphate phosphatase Spo0E family protein [Aquibacillus koreensis]|uniref:Aspartyl-phosphate phosphatase Spo0E family protein n=1 Tax=Aquibacillus koreensis TaxID=279446 RepID=A0A9X3WM43_9BACI|nr:aspartyl-phosphate phosphatase Spo0E family protein [Aquibacillus koreensis]MCT2534610.1 aspartyl-phosphate phosphatase Spo0E family protein [Aquibacillus koreensis]MDC3419794.1 aspartyl-phosphate phosphatase Spo0E family protein [Aquibacillus koreensis]
MSNNVDKVIEALRIQMYNAYLENPNSKEVIEISQKLDEYILLAMKN